MKKNKKKTRKKRIIILASVGFIVVLLLGSIEYTSHSQFCNSCHYMKPFYKSWETSSHGHIDCNACHYPPGIRSKLRAKVEGILQVGRYWTKLYLKSKPWAEIPDESCLRGGCHEKRLLEGRSKFNKIVFDHKIHFDDLKRGKQLRCTSCHSQIVQGEHITVTNSTCFICHFKESEHYPQISECSHCHHKDDLISEKISKFNHSIVFDKGFECNKCHSNTIIGDGEVPRENCYKCHWERDRLDKYDDTDLMHLEHIASNKIECNQCHLDIQHKIIKEIDSIADCQTCHTDYHKAQKILFAGEGGKGVTHPVPNIMFKKGLSCKGCHIFHEETGGKAMKSETFVSKAQACESCHGKGFARIMKEWELSTDRKLSRIGAIYKNATQELRRTKSAQKKKAQKLLEEAAFNIDIVERGKSVHNVEYSQELLSASYNKLMEALKLINSSYKPEAFLAVAKEVPTQCSNCHAGIEEINKQIFGLDFPHEKHLIEQEIQCDVCHSNVRKHGEFIATKQSCAVCHHKDPNKDCTNCHHLQKTFYQGGTLYGQEIPKDIMSEAEAECTDCHLGPQNKIFRSDANKCLDCHEEGYEEVFVEWQNSVKELVNSLKASLKEKRKLSLSQEEKSQISNIKGTLRGIELDGSSGIHNYSAIEELLTNFQKILKSLGTSTLDAEKKFY
ncbi:MAG: cytochrome c3 family protein [Candidatus Aminicenantes bacterium]|nr:MAG: cytochrome c3 family protein [Candidatus Aminicenantes bacterium]